MCVYIMLQLNTVRSFIISIYLVVLGVGLRVL